MKTRSCNCIPAQREFARQRVLSVAHWELNMTLVCRAPPTCSWKDLACARYFNELPSPRPMQIPSKSTWFLRSDFCGRSHFQHKTSNKRFSQPLCFPIEAVQMSVVLALSLTFTHLHQSFRNTQPVLDFPDDSGWEYFTHIVISQEFC